MYTSISSLQQINVQLQMDLEKTKSEVDARIQQAVVDELVALYFV